MGVKGRESGWGLREKSLSLQAAAAGDRVLPPRLLDDAGPPVAGAEAGNEAGAMPPCSSLALDS
jgi:hypothetical protein